MKIRTQPAGIFKKICIKKEENRMVTWFQTSYTLGQNVFELAV